tara:strand:- start:10 stop:303 length:294 start_codon:yes stop_codon:yes gene_type:complete
METPLDKKLVGNQHKLNEGLKAAIEAAPEGPINMVTPVVDPSTGMPITPMQPSNTMGMAKPVFDNTATQAAAGVFGQMQAPGQLARVLPTPLNKYKK